ncbi:M18 family aminopeptidase [Peptostreptococcus faecalis]|uniref:M18 family aminopeptidase n=1 Tax=Peptostreptococcus faecalis TaxID=2045015 RepID=UPI000C7A5A50|nr:M18 family aminopeptidase [Peptostreptococcus faecalis]
MLRKDSVEISNNLIDFINDSPTMYNAVENTKQWLENHEFQELKVSDKWDLKVGRRYFVSEGSSSLVAFNIKGSSVEEDGFRIIGSHSDSPTFRIKSNPEVKIGEQIKLNVEPYGGMIISSWFDRPLAIAGRVFLRNEDDVFNPREVIIKIDKPICIIPNLAIHMNRDINTGYNYNKQNDVMPLILNNGGIKEKKGYFKNFISNEIGNILNEEIDTKDILDYDLFLYEYEKGSIIGEKDEFISCARLDNLASVHASTLAFIDSLQEEDVKKDNEDMSNFNGVNMIAIFNNEEVGSQSKEGADSDFLANTIERICLSLNKDREDTIRSLKKSFMISADLAHTTHPNKPEESDPTNKPVFGGGPAIKIHAGKAYASDSYTASIYRELCNKYDIKCQDFANRSDKRSGGTIGSITSSRLSIPIVDVGIPILAMHSVRELANVEDYRMYYESFYRFYQI